MEYQYLDYQILCHWRKLCEYLGDDYPVDPYVSGSEYLYEAGLDNPYRRFLWGEFGIQLIRWTQIRVRGQTWKGWQNTPDWESKLFFLEKVIILDIDPETLPMPWLDFQLMSSLERLNDKSLTLASTLTGCNYLRALIAECRDRLHRWQRWNERRPAETDAVLGGQGARPRAWDAVLGGRADK